MNENSVHSYSCTIRVSCITRKQGLVHAQNSSETNTHFSSWSSSSLPSSHQGSTAKWSVFPSPCCTHVRLLTPACHSLLPLLREASASQLPQPTSLCQLSALADWHWCCRALAFQAESHGSNVSIQTMVFHLELHAQWLTSHFASALKVLLFFSCFPSNICQIFKDDNW